MLRRFAILAILMGTLGCRPPQAPPAVIDYSTELPPGTNALRKLSPAEYPDFSAIVTHTNLSSLLIALQHSQDYLATPSSARVPPCQGITHDQSVATLVALKQILQNEINNPAYDSGLRFDSAVKATFDVYQSIGGFDKSRGTYTGDVLFTGYFTPTYDASPVRTETFRYPLYKRPTDLVTDPTGEEAHRKSLDGSTAPAFTRAQIEQQHALDGGEFVWLADRFSAYVVTVQGSARLRMPDGQILEAGYNGNNGYPYASPGRQMLADGAITRDQLTLAGLRRYFATHPQAMDHYLPLNPRTVFFTERKGGPFGSLNQPVTRFATVATDKSIFPRALPVFAVVPFPTSSGVTDFRGLLFDQDTGGAIRAPARCDIYMGLSEEAGRELDIGQLYYLVVH